MPSRLLFGLMATLTAGMRLMPQVSVRGGIRTGALRMMQSDGDLYASLRKRTEKSAADSEELPPLGPDEVRLPAG